MSTDPSPQAANITVRLAENREEIRAAQRLRYEVFYEEYGARPTPEMAADRLDFDAFDDIMDHLIVIDPSHGAGTQGIVGTYRLLRHDAAKKIGRFYTSDEYDISPLLNSGAKLLELGRSCVLAQNRTRPVLQLLWSGIAQYVTDHQIDLLFGCASLHGTDPKALGQELAFLHHYHLAPAELRPCALPGRYVNMNFFPREELDARRIFSQLPPLIKGYLRVGATIGDGAVVDEQFNTTDVCIVLPTHMVTDRYSRHYLEKSGSPATPPVRGETL